MVDVAGLTSASRTASSSPTMIDIPQSNGFDDGDVSCSLCPKSFANHKLLQQHQQLFHTDKSFVCEICGKAFRFRSNLAEHRSVHTALKPFVCKFCGKSSRLKGNLTKHILKHHKKEQNEQIGKDDIIIKKGKKSVKDPAAVDFLEQSMIVVSQSNSQEVPVSLLPKAEEPQTDYEKSILLSFGFDQGSMDLTNSPPDNADSPDNASVTDSSIMRQDCMDSDISTASPLPLNSTVGGATSLHALLASVATPPPSSASNHSNSSKTQCTECGKHFRKGSGLQLHMVLNHGFPPPMSNASSDEKMSECEAPISHEPTVGEVALLQNDVKQMKSILNDLKAAQMTTKIEQLLSGLDTRVGRLEKQVEMALNSIYTLVQLQTGVNTSVTRFRDDATEQLKAVRSLLSSATESS